MSDLQIAVTFATADLRLVNLALYLGTMGLNGHFAPEAQKALHHPATQLHVLTGISPRDVRHGTLFAHVGDPRLAGRVSLNQLADLFVATAIEVGVVVGTFLPVGSTHVAIIQ